MKHTLKRTLALLLVLLFAIPTFAFAEDLGVVSVEDIEVVEDVATDDVVVAQADEEEILDVAEDNAMIGEEDAVEPAEDNAADEIAEDNAQVVVTYYAQNGNVYQQASTAENGSFTVIAGPVVQYYTFQGWATEPNGAVVYKENDVATATNPMSLYPVYKGVEVTVNYMYYRQNGYSGTAEVFVSKKAEYGQLLEKPTEVPDWSSIGRAFMYWKYDTNDAHIAHFAGDSEITATNEAQWKVGGTYYPVTTGGTSANPTYSISLYARSTESYFLKLFTVDPDGVVSTDPVINKAVGENEEISLADYVKVGQTFAVRVSQSATSHAVNYYNATTKKLTTPNQYTGLDGATYSNNTVTLYLVYTNDTHTVTFDTSKSTLISGTNLTKPADLPAASWTAGTSSTNAVETIVYGKKALEPTVTLAGNIALEGWYTSQVFTEANKFDFATPITSDIVLYPYVAETVGITYRYVDSNGNAQELGAQTPADAKATIIKGTALPKPSDPTFSGAKFVDWYTSTNTASIGSAVTLAASPYNFSTAVNANLVLYAKFTFNVATYPVHVKYIPKGATTTDLVAESPVQQIPSGSTAVEPTLPAENPNGMVFDHWRNALTDQPFTFNTPITAELYIEAVYKPVTKRVTIEATGGKLMKSGVQQPFYQDVALNKVFGTTGDFTTLFGTPERDYYNWDGKVYKDSAFTTEWNMATDKVTEDTTLYLKWVGRNVTVSFNGNGGTLNPAGTVTIPYGSNFFEASKNAPTATKANSTFIGWTFNKTVSGVNTAVDFDVLQDPVDAAHGVNTSSMTLALTAKYAVSTFTVKFDTDGGTAVPEQYVAGGGTLNTKAIVLLGAASGDRVAPVKEGNNVVGWYADKAKTQAVNLETVTISADTTFYVKWEPAEYTATFCDVNGTPIQVTLNKEAYADAQGKVTLAYGKKLSRPDDPAATASGVFEEWYEDKAFTTPFNFDALLTKDVTVYGKFAAVYSATIYYKKNQTAAQPYTSVPVYVKADNKSTVDASEYAKDSRAGAFVAWYDSDPSLTTAKVVDPAATVITANGKTFYAKYDAEKTTVQVTFNFDTGVADQTQWVTKGSTVTAPTAKADGKTFVAWKRQGTDGQLDANAFDFATPIEADTIFLATWSTNTYTLTFESNGGSAVNPITGIQYGDIPELPLPTMTGFNFIGWHDNAALAGKSYGATAYSDETYYEVTKDTTLYAEWAPINYEISLNLGTGNYNNVTWTGNTSGNLKRAGNLGNYRYYVVVPCNETLPEFAAPAGGTNQSFVDWFTDSACTKPFDPTTKVTGSFTLYAKFLNGVTVSLNAANWVYDGKAHPEKVTATATPAHAADSSYVPAVVIEYKKAGDPDTAYTTQAPVVAATYKVRASVAASTRTAPAKQEADLIIAQKDVTLKWGTTTEFTYNGAEQAPTVEVIGAIEGETVTAIVKGATEVGEHTAEATLPADSNYKFASSAIKTQKFKIVANTTAPTVEATVNPDGTVTIVTKDASGNVLTTDTVKIGDAAAATKDFDVKTVQNPDGSVTVTMTPKSTSGYKFAPITVTGKPTELPAPTELAAKVGKKKATFSWTGSSDAEGYTVQYGLKKKASKCKTVTVKGASTKAVKKLKKGKKYWFRVQAFKTVNGVQVVSAWSSWKKTGKIK